MCLAKSSGQWRYSFNHIPQFNCLGYTSNRSNQIGKNTCGLVSFAHSFNPYVSVRYHAIIAAWLRRYSVTSTHLLHMVQCGYSGVLHRDVSEAIMRGPRGDLLNISPHSRATPVRRAL